MKKSLIVLALAVFTTTAFAQEVMTSKKGTPILPEAGDWAIGVDATPFIEFFGNVMNNSNNIGAPSWTSPFSSLSSSSAPILYAKYVKDQTTHYRAMVRLGFGSSKENFVIQKDSTDGSSFTPAQYGSDESKTSGNGITLGAGIEKRKGKGRIQGFYGAMAMIGFGSEKTTNTFANAITTDNPTPSTTYNMQGGLYRIKEVKEGGIFNLGIRGFIGVEYFFMAKASLGAEFGWGLSMSSKGEGETTSEGWNGTAVETQKVPGPGKTSSFGIDTDNGYASINLLFYF
ncbi:MAG: hypothetical protein LC117_01650 [Bacteroidia bacterium]|nr:hypothetical protein [Bacteroidia bacterium]MCZ2276619.1 hypothetical protein [Bacteroidia bacterium]